jgi:protocatechuate 3,4-dioxygenase beta subunit
VALRTTRRQLVTAAAAAGVAGLALHRPAGRALAALTATPPQTTGPFYPVELPLDSDNDLVQVAGRAEQAAGQVLHLFGRVLDPDGRPLSGAQVQIWQCDAQGYYHHPGDRGGRADPNFQGFGTARAAADGAYRFRTLRPVPYPGRTPHIHFAVLGAEFETLVTQMYLRGEPRNERDGLFRSIRDPAQRDSVLVAVAPAPEVEAGAEAGTFDLVVARSLFKS